MQGFNIARATPHDAQRLARLNAFVHDLHVEAHPDFFRATDLGELTTLFRDSLEDAATSAFVARDDDGVPVGYVLTKYVDRKPTPLHHRRTYLEIDQIAVDPAHRRRGLAHVLVACARDEARERGVDRIQLSTWTFNEGAQRFFESEGFAPRLTAYWQQLD